MAQIRIEALTGDALAAALPELAALRIAVFRAWPYLYDGDAAYERWYLSKYAAAEGSVIVGAYDGARLVGAATGAPMTGQLPEWSAPFRAKGYDIGAIFYCGESVLLPEYRGHGVGHAFFDHREAQAKRIGGMTHACFCGVIRPDDHPARPAGYRPLDPFWRARGYAPLEGVIGQFPWREIGQTEETMKPMQFWIKRL